MSKNLKCLHGKRKISCKQCGGSQICSHSIQRSTCIPCQGGSVCTHKKQKSTCRICDIAGWAKSYITISKQQAKRYGYAPPKITAQKVIDLVSLSKNCAGCGGVLSWETQSPCLHHNHETGEVIGFTHRFCNTLEGFLMKLEPDKLVCFLNNFFPDIVAQIKAKS